MQRLFRMFVPVSRVVQEIFLDIFFVEEAVFECRILDLTDAYSREIPCFPLREVISCCRYSKEFSDRLKEFKYDGDRSAIRFFRDPLELLATRLRTENPKGAFITYPPAPLFRTISRGYDHTALLAERLARLTGFPVVRVFETGCFREKQSVLNGVSRMSNIVGKFRLKKGMENVVEGRQAIFFDDVITSGATTIACSDILIKAGCSSVSGYFLSSSTI